MFYNHFIVILYHFLVLAYWHSAKCQLLFFACFLHRRKSIPNGIKMQRNFLWIFWTRRHPMGRRSTWGGAPRGAQPTRVRLPISGASRTDSLLYKYPNIPETLGELMKYSSSRRRVHNHQIQSRHHLGWGSPPPLVPLRWCVSSSL